MRKYLLLLIVHLAIVSMVHSQYSHVDTTSFIFELRTDEARKLTENYNDLNQSYFHSLVDSADFRLTKLSPRSYASGHYLIARAEGQHVKVSFTSVNTISAVLLPNNRDLLLQVYDSLGQQITNAKVQVGNKEILYNAKRGGYFKPKWKKEGLVEIAALGETLFYQLQKESYGWKLFKARYAYFKKRKIGRVLTYPARLGKSIYYGARNAITNKSYFPNVGRRVVNRWRNKFQYKGYVAMHQPVYQPWDTLKVKAYITNRNGKPLKRELSLKLRDHYSRGKLVFDVLIKPDKFGNYTYEFPLGDSLKLDQNYTLTFYDHKRWRKTEFVQQFHYEDYQLDEVTWSLSLSKDMYHYGDPVLVFAEGKDANGNTIPDGQVKLTLTAGHVSNHFENPSYIPDTIWQETTSLRPRDKTQIVVPDSIIPIANMHLNLNAEFSNSNGETHQEGEDFLISRDRERIKAEVRNGYVYAVYYKEGRRVDTTGVIEYWLGDDVDVVTKDSIDFPLKRRINPYVFDYDLRVGDASEYLSLDESFSEDAQSNVFISGSWNEGVAEFRLSNPHKIPVNYTILTKDRLILRDSSTSANKVIFSKSKYHGAYYVKYNYVWGGTVHKKEAQIRPYKKQLNITLKQEAKIRPGDLVNTEIEIKNYKGKAAKGVNLTAGAYNAQFKKRDNFSDPQINYKIKRSPFAFDNYTLEQKKYGDRNISMSPFFYDTFDLQDRLFYHVRYGNSEGMILQYDTLTAPQYQKMAQVAPYIIKDGKEVPAEMIYLNSKLVYYAGTTILQPYSFIGYTGNNTITIRTQNNEYSIKDVELKRGNKLELFINLNTVWNSEFKDKIAAKGVARDLTLQEKKILNLSLFQYRSSRYFRTYFWQDNTPVFIIPSNYNYSRNTCVIGPFQPSIQLGFVMQDRFMKSFTNTPGYEFEIYQNRERLYANTLFDLDEKYVLPWRNTFQNMGQVVYTTEDIITQNSTPRNISFGRSNFGWGKESGRYQIQIPADTSINLVAMAITNAQDSLVRLIRPNERTMRHVRRGDYHIYLFTSNGYYAKHPFTIKAYHLLHEDLSELQYQKDSLDIIFNRLSNAIALKSGRKLDPYTAQFVGKRKNTIVGRIKTPEQDSTRHIFQVDLFKDDLVFSQTKTDSSGLYNLECYPGVYDLKIVSNVDGGAFTFPVFVTDSSVIRLDLIYHEKAFYLNEIEVIGYKEPLIKQDNTTQGSTVTSSEIRNLPTRSINGLASTSAGVSSSVDADMLHIRGGRTDATVYYIDGVQVRGNLIPTTEYAEFTHVASGVVTDASGEPVMFCAVVLIVDGQVMGGTETNLDGYYSVNVPSGSFQLQASFIGFQPTTIESSSSGLNIDFIMEESVFLDEVMVVAYSEPRLKAATSDLLSLSSEDTPPELEGGVQLRSDFRDYAYWQPNLITDKDGKASFQTVFPDKITNWRTFVIGVNRKSQAGIAYANTQSVKPLVAQLALPRFLVAGDESTIIGKSVNYTSDTYTVESQFVQDGTVLQTNTSDVKEALIESANITAPLDVDSLAITYKLQTGDYGDGEEREIPVFPNGIEETLGAFYVLEGDTTISIDFDASKGPVTIYSESDVLSLMLEDLDYLVKYPYGCNEQTASRLIALLLEKQVRKTLDQPFEHEDKIIKMIIRLKSTQNEDGSWGWWSKSAHSNWITVHVLKALAKAKTEGYTSAAFEKGMRYLANFLPVTTKMQQLEILELFSSVEQRANYEGYLNGIDSLDLSLRAQYRVIKLKQEQNLEYELDSLEVHRRSTLFDGDFWGENTFSILSEDVGLSLLAYAIYKNEGDEKRLRTIRQFFLMRRSDLSRTYGRRFGRNTYETAKILAALLPDVLEQAKGGELKANALIINGNATQRISKFPFKQVLHGESTIQVRKEGTGSLFLTAYQTFFNENPLPKRDIFDVESKLVQNDKTVKKLKQGERVELLVHVKVDKKTEYAMIEIPIPAACSYASKPNSRRGIEVHREYFKNKTAIFCRDLPEGDHEFKIELEARFAGQYTLLPSKVEQMYFPVFYGRNEVKRVKVE